jgi:hypothetical protein
MASETGQTTGIKTETTRLVQWAAIVGFVGQIIWWAVSTVLGVLWPKYNAVNDPISLLAAVGSPHAGVQQLGFYVFGASIIVFAIGLFVWSNRGWQLMIGIPLLVVFGSGVIAGGFFQYDPNNLQAATTQNHILASLITFPTAVLAISVTSWGLNHDDRWPNYRNKFLPFGIAILGIATFAILMMGVTTPWQGFTQRMFLLVLTGWVAYHANKLRKLTQG